MYLYYLEVVSILFGSSVKCCFGSSFGEALCEFWVVRNHIKGYLGVHIRVEVKDGGVIANHLDVVVRQEDVPAVNVNVQLVTQCLRNLDIGHGAEDFARSSSLGLYGQFLTFQLFGNGLVNIEALVQLGSFLALEASQVVAVDFVGNDGQSLWYQKIAAIAVLHLYDVKLAAYFFELF